jgi:hypothetical protein
MWAMPLPLQSTVASVAPRAMGELDGRCCAG